MKLALTAFILSILGLAGPVFAQPFAYITNQDGGNVTVIDTATNMLVGSPIAVESFPNSSAVSQDGRFVYVANGGSQSVSVIDTSTNTVTATVAVGAGPGGIAVTPDGSFVYVANQSDNNVSVIDTSTNSVVGSPISVQNAPSGAAVSPDGNFVYVTNFSSSTVSVIDTSTNTVTSTVNVGLGPLGITVSPDGSRVYTANNGLGPGSVSVIRSSDNVVIATVTVGTQPRGVTVTPDGMFVYASNAASGTVSVIRTSDNMVVDTVTVGSLPQGVDVTPDGSFVYAANQGPGTVSVIRTSDNTVVDTISVGNVSWGPSAIGKFIGPTPVTLDITLTGTGEGNVSAEGIDCGEGGMDCEETYHIIGTMVDLTAALDDTSFFSGWSGGAGCTGNDPNITVTMDVSKTCTASFTQDPAITVNKVGTGDGTITSIPAGIDCAPGCTTEMAEFAELSMVELTAAPDATSFFSGWSGGGGCSGTDPTITLTMDNSKSCTASFTEDPAVTVTKEGNGDGTITSVPAGINCAPGCTTEIAEFMELSMVELTAAPDPDSDFMGWTGDPECAGMLTMDMSRSCTAAFTLKRFTLDITKAGNGGGTVTSVPKGIDCGDDCSEIYNVNTEVSLTAAPDADSIFRGWAGDPDCSDGRVTIGNNTTCTALFTLKQFKLSIMKIGFGTGTVTSAPPGIDCGGDCSELYNINTVVTLTPDSVAGSEFGGWTGDPGCEDGVVTMDMNSVCRAIFNQIPPPAIISDVSVVKSASDDPVEAGSELTYSLVIRNSGPKPASGVKVTDMLPEAVMLVSASEECAINDRTVICSYDGISIGETREVSIVVVPLETGSLTNSAVVTSTTRDPNPDNNSSSVVVEVVGDITEFLTVEPDVDSITTEPGGLVSAAAEISNPDIAERNAPVLTKQTATGVVVSVELPEGFDAVELLSTQGTCDVAVLECSIGDILLGDTVTVVVDAIASDMDGLFDLVFRANTSTGQEFSGNLTVRVRSGGGGGSSCALSSKNVGHAGLLGLLSPFALLFVLMIIRRNSRRE